MSDYQTLFPPRGQDLPQRVHGFLRLCELANAWYDWQEEHHDTPKAWFCEGVVDYWWDDDLIEPGFEMLFQRPLDPSEKWSGWPSHKRFCYQQGAIVGYRLKEKYKDE